MSRYCVALSEYYLESMREAKGYGLYVTLRVANSFCLVFILSAAFAFCFFVGSFCLVFFLSAAFTL